VAPILPETALAAEAKELFDRRARGDQSVEPRLSSDRLVTPHYQHVEGTSFAAPLVTGVVACMIEANPALAPRRIRELLVAAAHPVPGAPPDRQGAGALDAGRAVTLALTDRRPTGASSPRIGAGAVEFLLDEGRARTVAVVGSWDGWREPGLAAIEQERGLWGASLPRPASGTHHYKFLLDGGVWLADPANPVRAHDGYGAWNSVLSC
jgi:serine protease AprX